MSMPDTGNMRRGESVRIAHRGTGCACPRTKFCPSLGPDPFARSSFPLPCECTPLRREKTGEGVSARLEYKTPPKSVNALAFRPIFTLTDPPHPLMQHPTHSSLPRLTFLGAAVASAPPSAASIASPCQRGAPRSIPPPARQFRDLRARKHDANNA